MISKNKIKLIQSLAKKKGRDDSGLFIAEGDKLIAELIKANFLIEYLISTNELLSVENQKNCEIITTTESEMKKISLLKTAPSLLAIVKQPAIFTHINPLPDDLILVLDTIQDPGNLGTIIRLASWFGIQTIICSEGCVDCFNPKVIQATMGAIAHVQLIYTNLNDLLIQALNENRTIYGTFLEGENIYKCELEKNGLIVFGNEGNGISEELKKHIKSKIFIPSFNNKNKTIESLNVSTAASIVCSEFRRRIF